MSDENTLLLKWTEIKDLFEALDADVVKNAKGNLAAGVRARKGLRQIQSATKQLVKATLDLEKSKKEKSSKE